MVGGFSECIEKYFETITDLAARGLSVWCLDWRGQGGSERPRRLPSRPRPRRFDRDAVELALFTRTIPAAGWPRVLIGHSMGGAIALLCLRRYPGLFDAAILSAPMLGIRTGGLPSPLVRCISSLARAAGLGMRFVPGAAAWQPDRIPSPERSRVSNDPVRCRLQYEWFVARAGLRVDEPTWGWLDASLRLAAKLAREGVSVRNRHSDPARQRWGGDFCIAPVPSPCRRAAARLHLGRVSGLEARTLSRTRPDTQSLARSDRPVHHRARRPHRSACAPSSLAPPPAGMTLDLR
jgi:alpha-beta hydrolase superfamily lysophospholipase